MSSAIISVPRFLLPRGARPLRRVSHHGTALRSSAVSDTPAHVRFGSTIKSPTSAKQQQPPRHTVLEKPEKFNPPSHGARLPKKGYTPPRTYGGDLSSEQIKVQNTKDYPGMPPPQGSMAHRIIHNRRLHAFISIVSFHAQPKALRSDHGVTRYEITNMRMSVLPLGCLDYLGHLYLRLELQNDLSIRGYDPSLVRFLLASLFVHLYRLRRPEAHHPAQLGRSGCQERKGYRRCPKAQEIPQSARHRRVGRGCWMVQG